MGMAGPPTAAAAPCDVMEMTMAQRPPLPYEFMPPVPSFAVESDDVAEGQQMTSAQVFNGFGMTGQNISPHLRWSGFPEETRSFAVTCLDPDAPTGSGFWHLVLLDVPVSVTELATGAVSGDKPGMPPGSFCVRNDYGTKDFGGAAPPPNSPPHRYIFAVHALDVDSVQPLGVDSDVTPAVAGLNVMFHTIARGMVIPVYNY
jgi:Raf kinase inhibitor-like YbhB/YbcL family protein